MPNDELWEKEKACSLVQVIWPAMTLLNLTRVGHEPHELLQYVDALFKNGDLGPFLERFGLPGLVPELAMTYALKEYEQALCEACADPEKTIVITHKGFPALLQSFSRESSRYAQ